MAGAKGLYGVNGVGATPFTQSPYYWDMDVGTIIASGELHGLDIATTGTLSSGAGLVGLNIITTTAGTAGAWACGLYVKVYEGTTKNVNGYLNAAEFELATAGSYNCSDLCVIALNSTMNNSGGAISHPAYIYLRDYGTKTMDNFMWIADATIATHSITALISTVNTAATNWSHGLRCIVGSTPVWIMCTTTTPAA